MEIDIKREELDDASGSELTPAAASTAVPIKTEDGEYVAIKSETETPTHVLRHPCSATIVNSESPVKAKTKKRVAGAAESDTPRPRKSRRIGELQESTFWRSRTPAHPRERLLAPSSDSEAGRSRQEEAPAAGHIIHDGDQVCTKEKLQGKDEAMLQKALAQFKDTVEEKGLYKIRECVTPLTVWQFVSAEQMIRRERVRKAPFGGALCSEMGVSRGLLQTSATDGMDSVNSICSSERP